jgi:hypothetical protein
VTILGIGHTTDPDIQTLPDAVPKGKFKPIKMENPTFITFDLETTDLSELTFAFLKPDFEYRIEIKVICHISKLYKVLK